MALTGSLSGKIKFIGIESALKRLNAEIDKISQRSELGVFEGLVAIEKDAIDRAPEVLQNLKRSAFVVTDKYEHSRNDFIGYYFDTSQYKANHKRVISRAKEAIHKTQGISGQIGFSIPYAMYVHENPRAGKTGGISPNGKIYKEGTYSKSGSWKFLEMAVRRGRKKVLKAIYNRAKF